MINGAAQSSFGTHVASLAGVSEEVVKRAEQISTDFAKQFRARLETKRSTSSRLPLVTQADFAFLAKTASNPRGLDKKRLASVLKVLSSSSKTLLTATT